MYVTVHIVEDDFGVSDALSILVEGMGHDAVVYPDAESFFEGEPPASGDLVIVDLGLPGVSGAQVVRWLGEFRDPPKVIVISGQPGNRLREMLSGINPFAFLRKPLSEEELAPYL
ncbi:response regulator [Pannonibacter phragmitetus]|uniref:response regulator n=1 Tax=Pannonibacter phragmitetus TaxID=121719 RepID=UPI000F44BD12|nr:response regulator [Pannonibacter phragmitetus]MBA4205444.1 response regulator [Polymorphum sp.]